MLSRSRPDGAAVPSDSWLAFPVAVSVDKSDDGLVLVAVVSAASTLLLLAWLRVPVRLRAPFGSRVFPDDRSELVTTAVAVVVAVAVAVFLLFAIPS